MKSTERITLIGGGVSGITTGLTLQLMGFDTTCYTQHLVDGNTRRDPRFASLYPAASVIPHSVHSAHLDTIFPASLAIFEAMHKANFNHVAVHRHFEIYEFPKPFPAYTKYLHNLANIGDQVDSTIPRRPGAENIHGWSFNCFVAEWPAYMKQLYALYNQAGGQLVQKRIEPGDIKNLLGDIIVNCSGAWSTELFDDPIEQEFIRGHLVHVPGRSAVTMPGGKLASYNYTPKPSIYATPQGQPSDVYCYPINGKLILGGSRQVGSVNQNGYWHGKTHDETVKIDDINVPEPIIKLNEKILDHTFNQSLGNKNKFSAYIGYRHSRKGSNGLRLEKSPEHQKMVIHNYGHGGAGVTLSWGAALKVLQLVYDEIGISEIESNNARSSQLDVLRTSLHQNYLQHFQSS